MNYTQRVDRIANMLENHPDFPKPGILFRDVFPVCRNAQVFRDLIDLLVEHMQEHCKGAEVIVGLESRGFIFGPPIADKLNISFVPVRKKGKLPGECIAAAYTKEYGADEFEVQKAAIKPGQKVVIIDDLLATGGTMAAAIELMKKTQAVILECVVVIELSDLKGRDKVNEKVFSLIPLSD